ncbi:flagellar hook-length control protein FliK [Salipiger sp. PrR002]|uniref:flagellar hook-length control protein FliK n=1 Tax=Salipiger sp. PrR002 TaxID=2706489 RepID=UPI0013BA9D79|nr:flagellar hook-length control protein FliK [Salipiger sp. PrR002]NDW00960.1 flagellar hook-length control protein FliK [Salipiger sp. PrR002]NDW56507.1 flagellar hook-length control protein FliK [Salipiger sp. PrR004]
MINLLSAIGVATPTDATNTAQEAEAETPFAGLLALLGGEAATEGEQAEESALSDLLAETEAALADPDLSDAEIADILAPLLARLGAEMAANPALMARVEAMVADLGDAQAETLEASTETEETETPWRQLAEGVSDLQDLLDVSEEIEGDGAELAALLSHVLDVAAEMTQEVARPFSPVLVGLDQLVASPLRGAGMVQGTDAPQAAADLTDLATEQLQDTQADTNAETGEQGAETGTEDAPEFGTDTQRAAQASAAAFTPAALSGGDAQVQVAQSTTLQGQATPLAPVSAMPIAASAMAASQLAGNAPQMAAPQGQEIMGQIRANLRDDGQIKVELKPEGLGKVEISLGPDEAGKMQVVVRADQAAVLSALRADRDGLVAMLRDAGHAVEDGALSFSDLGGDTGAQGGASGGSDSGFITYGTAGDEASGLAGAAQTETLRLPEGSVDIRI